MGVGFAGARAGEDAVGWVFPWMGRENFAIESDSILIGRG